MRSDGEGRGRPVVEVASEDAGPRKWIMDIAAGEGHLPLVEWLHVNVPTDSTAAAMDCAAENGRLEVVEFLHGNRSEGCTERALNGAVENGHVSVTRFLFETKGVSTVAGDGLCKAAEKGYLEVIKMALDWDAFVRED
ncbi:hypothetical protein DFJ73DRAFT_863981 [Zopfochytrium polystomum]|nr:hypothetical protein DFJ73DRAFT_863981 [Zopfochytrium polystomum]